MLQSLRFSQFSKISNKNLKFVSWPVTRQAQESPYLLAPSSASRFCKGSATATRGFGEGKETLGKIVRERERHEDGGSAPVKQALAQRGACSGVLELDLGASCGADRYQRW